jgi:hypothetical protein
VHDVHRRHEQESIAIAKMAGLAPAISFGGCGDLCLVAKISGEAIAI